MPLSTYDCVALRPMTNCLELRRVNSFFCHIKHRSFNWRKTKTSQPAARLHQQVGIRYVCRDYTRQSKNTSIMILVFLLIRRSAAPGLYYHPREFHHARQGIYIRRVRTNSNWEHARTTVGTAAAICTAAAAAAAAAVALAESGVPVSGHTYVPTQKKAALGPSLRLVRSP